MERWRCGSRGCWPSPLCAFRLQTSRLRNEPLQSWAESSPMLTEASCPACSRNSLTKAQGSRPRRRRMAVASSSSISFQSVVHVADLPRGLQYLRSERDCARRIAECASHLHARRQRDQRDHHRLRQCQLGQCRLFGTPAAARGRRHRSDASSEPQHLRHPRHGAGRDETGGHRRHQRRASEAQWSWRQQPSRDRRRHRCERQLRLSIALELPGLQQD